MHAATRGRQRARLACVTSICGPRVTSYLLRQALALGVTLLLASSHVTPSCPRTVWLLTAGAAQCSAAALGEVVAAASARQIEMLALSLSGASLAHLGIPRWLAATRSGLPHLIAAIFGDTHPTSPNDLAPAAALPSLPAGHPWSSVAPLTPRLTPRDHHAPERIEGPAHAYMSGALDYVCAAAAPEEAAIEAPPAPSDDELDAFYRKVDIA